MIEGVWDRILARDALSVYELATGMSYENNPVTAYHAEEDGVHIVKLVGEDSREAVASINNPGASLKELLDSTGDEFFGEEV